MIDHRRVDYPFPYDCRCGERFDTLEELTVHGKEEDDSLREEMAALIEEELERVSDLNDGSREQIGITDMCDGIAERIIKQYYVFREDL